MKFKPDSTRRRVGQGPPSLASNSSNLVASKKNLRSHAKKRIDEPDNEEEKPTSIDIQAMTVARLREICVINNLGAEKALKKELVRKVTEFYAAKA